MCLERHGILSIPVPLSQTLKGMRVMGRYLMQAGTDEARERMALPAPSCGMLLFVVVPEHSHVCPTCRCRWECFAGCRGQITKACARCGVHASGAIDGSSPCATSWEDGSLA